MGEKILVSNIIEIQRIEIARYINKAYLPGEFFFYIFEELNVFVKHCSLPLPLSLSLFLFFFNIPYS